MCYLNDHLRNGKSLFLEDILKDLNLFKYIEHSNEIAEKLYLRRYINYTIQGSKILVYKIKLEGINFIEDQLIGNSNLHEIDELINETVNYDTVNIQLNTAKKYLQSSDTNDYRNAIKEAIGASESIVRVALGNNSITLGKGIKEICEQNIKHRAFTEAIMKLYGYNSDAGGSRHGLDSIDELPSYAESKYLVLVYSAFVNYVIEEIIKKN